MPYNKIRQPKLSDVIEQRLEELILEGSLQPGARLPSERELAKHFDVSRPSLREAIQRLEARGLLSCRQGGGTFVQASLWQSFSDPLADLLTEHDEVQFDLLETRHALEGISAYYAALRGSDKDLQRIADHYQAINQYEINTVAEQHIDAHTEAVLQYHLAITEASHNLVLLHLSRCMVPMLRGNIKQNLELLYRRQELLEQVNQHRTAIFTTIMARKPEQAWAASHRHLAFIEELMLALNREQSRRERSLRRLQFQQARGDSDDK